MSKILIVEDELSIANFIADLFQMLGCETMVLTSGKKVLETVKEWKPDLITLDIMIPPPDGLEVFAALKKDPETKSIPIFIVSAVTKSPEVARAISRADAIFQKPIDTKYFVEQIHKILSKKNHH